MNNFTGVTVAFSQSVLTTSEGDGVVLVCAELLTGDLERDISFLVDVLNLESSTGIYYNRGTYLLLQWYIYIMGKGLFAKN